MSYEPSHRKPPRQERWPDATPSEGWPACQHGDGGRVWEPAEAFAGNRNGYRAAGNGYRAAGNGYGDPRGGPGPGARGYGSTWDGARYSDPGQDYGWDRCTEPGHEFTGPAGHLAQDEYPAPDLASSVLVAPDTMGEWWRPPDRGHAGGRDPDRGPVVGVVTGLLAAAVAIGVGTLAAAFVRPQASPVSAVGGAFLGRLPASLRNHLMAHAGAHAQTVLLLGVIGLIAMVLGGMARRNPSAGVAGIAAFGLLGAFVAITRPQSRASDVIPSAIGGLAGIVALLWLARASRPVASVRPAYGGRRRPR